MEIFSNSSRYQTISNFKKFLNIKSKKNISTIIIPILIIICIYIKPIKILKDDAPKIVFGIDRKILEVVVIIY